MKPDLLGFPQPVIVYKGRRFDFTPLNFDMSARENLPEGTRVAGYFVQVEGLPHRLVTVHDKRDDSISIFWLKAAGEITYTTSDQYLLEAPSPEEFDDIADDMHQAAALLLEKK